MYICQQLRLPKLEITFVISSLTGIIISVLLWFWKLRHERGLLTDRVVDAHITFCALGALMFYVFSPLTFWAYKYQHQLPPRRRRELGWAGITGFYLFFIFPIWYLEFYIMLEYGILLPIQGVSLVLETVLFVVGFFFVWVGYTWKMAKIMQQRFGATMNELHPTTGLELTLDGVIGGSPSMKQNPSMLSYQSSRLPPERI